MTELSTAIEANPPVAPDQLTLVDHLRAPGLLDQVVEAIGNEQAARRLIRIVTTEARKTPKLMTCTPRSVLGGVLLAAQLDLDPGGPTGHCYLVPMDEKKNGQVVATHAEFWLGYRGMVELGLRSPKLRRIQAVTVREHDHFAHDPGPGGGIDHSYDPRATTAERGEEVLWYAFAELDGGGAPFVVINREEADRAKAASRGSRSTYSPWNTHYDAMARKTAVRRLWPWLPTSGAPQARTAMEFDERRPVWDTARAELDIEDPADTDGE